MFEQCITTVLLKCHFLGTSTEFIYLKNTEILTTNEKQSLTVRIKRLFSPPSFLPSLLHDNLTHQSTFFFFFDSTLLLQLFFFPTCLRPPLERVNYPLCGLCPLRQVLSFPHWHQGAPVRPGICDERGHAQVLSEGGVVQAFLLCPLLLLLSLLVSIRHIVRNTIRLHVK